MIQKMIPVAMAAVLALSFGCDGTTGDGAADERAALAAFNEAFAPSAQSLSEGLYAAHNGSIEAALSLKGADFWAENPVLEAIMDLGLSGAGEESVAALVALIKNGVLNPWTLLDTTSLNGTLGCVTWSTGVAFDLQLVQSVIDLFNGKWWTLTVLAKLEDCSDVSGEFRVVISGSRLGVVYTVHVTGELSVASMPDWVFDLDVLYSLEKALGSWDAVDWSATVNGIAIRDL
jgi:hypothetical protein